MGKKSINLKNFLEKKNHNYFPYFFLWKDIINKPIFLLSLLTTIVAELKHNYLLLIYILAPFSNEFSLL